MRCWTGNQTGYRKINCPQTTCFFCGRSGHLKRTCLLYRLVKMYDEEKNLYFHSLAGASKLADQERVAIELTNPKESDNPSDDIEKPCDEVSGTEKVLETFKTQAERSEGKLTTNQISEISNLTEAIQSQMQIPIESRELDEEGQWRRQSAKETVQQITENVLPMSHLQTPITVQEASHCTLSR